MRSVLLWVLVALTIELLAPIARIGMPLRGSTIWRPSTRVSVYRVKAVAAKKAAPTVPQQVAVMLCRARPRSEPRSLWSPGEQLFRPAFHSVVPLRANRPPPLA